MDFKKIIFLSFFLLFASTAEALAVAPEAINFAPNLWFDSEEKYYPSSPLDFYYENGREIPGELAKEKYDSLSLKEKIDNLVVFYEIKETEKEYVYQYWFFYVFNDFTTNDHYGDFETVFTFVDKNSLKPDKLVASAHNGSELKIIMANGELKNPKNHSRILVESGSHANWIDGDENGLRNKTKDISNWLNAWGIKKWSVEDKKYGVKVNYYEYKLLPLESIHIKDQLITQSPTLGFGKFSINGKRHYLTQLGGHPSRSPWEKPIFHNPEEIIPITGELVWGQIKRGVARMPEIFNQKKDQEAEKEIIAEENVGAGLAPAPRRPLGLPPQEIDKIIDNSRETTDLISQTEAVKPKVSVIDFNKLRSELKQVKQQTENIRLQIMQMPASETSGAVPFAFTFSGPPPPAAIEPNPAPMVIPETPETPEAVESPESEVVTELEIDKDPPFLIINQISPIITNATSTIISGTISENSVIYFNFSNSSSSLEALGNWQKEFALHNASSSLIIFAEDLAGNKSPEINISVQLDQEPPWGTVLDIQDEPLNLFLSGGFMGSDISSIIMEVRKDQGAWQKDDNLVLYDMFPDRILVEYDFWGEIASHYDFKITAADYAGNEIVWERSFDFALVRINEVAWMGNASSTSAEWIELYNNSSGPVSLAGWNLRVSDDTPDIDLTGEIESGEYLVLRRGQDYTGALENQGESWLTLYDPDGWYMDDVFTNPWPAGNNNTKQTMERVDYYTWQNSVSAGGTPGAFNSQY